MQNFTSQHFLFSQHYEKKNGFIAVFLLIIVFTPLGSRTIVLVFSGVLLSILPCLFYNSDALGVGIFPSRLVVYVHLALAHTFDLNCSAIYFHVISIDSRDGHSCGSVSCPPFDKQFNDCLFHFTN